MLPNLILYIFLAATLVQLLFWLGIYIRLAVFEPEAASETKTEQPVSIIICAHNEAENLARNLPRILNQNYRSYEILVINHNSTDNSEIILRYLSKTYSKLRFINLTNKKKGKKSALAKGIEEALHDVLLLTDADCYPNSKDWLRHMQSVIHENIEMGLGFAPMERHEGFLNKFIRFETNFTALQYLSFALASIPYMGVGRNLIYRKSLFQKVDGFKKHETITSGDDDLFVNAAAHQGNTRIQLHPSTFIFSPPKQTFQDWIRQKSRHLTTGRKYRPFHQLLLGAASASHIGHYVLGIGVVYYFGIIHFVYLYMIRQLVMLLIFGVILKKLHDASLIKWLPVLDAALVLYYLFYSPAIFFGNPKRNW